MSDMPLSEQFRITAKQWVDSDAAASILEETKSAFLSKKMSEQGDIAVSRAEMIVKSSPEWQDFVERMVRARQQANLLKVKLEFLRMKFSEQQSFQATRRAEMKL
ncbi:hypothetical protein [Azorhizobium caulinodans]|uniref:hypothetical protein n=1 Tax=Azorhizobium caulinodans TaxID=7 RepID=UPI002FBDA643